jgi:hypothetical protein
MNEIASCRGHFSAKTVATYYKTDEIVVKTIWAVLKERPLLTLIQGGKSEEEGER